MAIIVSTVKCCNIFIIVVTYVLYKNLRLLKCSIAVIQTLLRDDESSSRRKAHNVPPGTITGGADGWSCRVGCLIGDNCQNMSLAASRRVCCRTPLLSPPSSSVSHAAPLSRDCQVSQHASPCHSSKCLSCCFGYEHLVSEYIFSVLYSQRSFCKSRDGAAFGTNNPRASLKVG